MLAGIRDILIISTPGDLPRFKDIFGEGTDLGLRFSYAEQPKPNGLAEAFLIGEEFIGRDTVCLVLGDNIFFGQGLTEMLNKAVRGVTSSGGATVFGYYVKDPERYGIVEFDPDGNVLTIEEKPRQPRSRYASDRSLLLWRFRARSVPMLNPEAPKLFEKKYLIHILLRQGEAVPSVSCLIRGIASLPVSLLRFAIPGNY